jgi:hypothetical protein
MAVRLKSDLVHVGPACHDECLDLTRRYALTADDDGFLIHDRAQPGTDPSRPTCPWDEVLAIFGPGALLAVPDGDQFHVVDVAGTIRRTWHLPARCGRATQAQFSADGDLLWVHFDQTRTLCVMDRQNGSIHGPADTGGEENLGALWVHPARPLAVLDTYRPQDYSRFVVLGYRAGALDPSPTGHEHDDLAEFIGFDRSGDNGTFADSKELRRWSLTTGKPVAGLDADDLFPGEEGTFNSRATSLEGHISVLWTRDEAERVCVLTDAFDLVCAIDFTGADDQPYGAELMAGSILRVPFADSTSYYRLTQLD